MSTSDVSDMDMDTAMASDDIPMSPISAADMLNRSRRMSRRTLTSTPARRLFPENVDSIAPGLTPTSKNQRKRKSQGTGQTPRRSARLSAAPSSILAASPGPYSTIIEENLVADDDMQLTPIITPLMESSSPFGPPETPVQPLGKRQARESGDSTGRILTFGGWGNGREESPMEMLRRLAQAPGQLSSPIDERSVFMPSISERLDRERASTHQVDTASQASTSKRPPLRHSAANTSMTSSEVGQGRRAARQSARDNIFSDLTDQEASGNQTFRTNRKSDVFTLGGDMTNIPREEGSLSSTLNLMDAATNREQELEKRIANESTRQVNGFDTSSNLTRRLENLSASFDQSDDRDLPIGSGQALHDASLEYDQTRSPIDNQFDNPEDDNDRTILAGDQAEHDLGNVTTEESERRYEFNQADDLQQETNQANSSENDSDDTSSEEEEVEVIDQSKEVRAARMALLRKRRAKKKAKRISSITGKTVPSLPSDLVKSLFTTFTTPNAAVGSIPSGNTGKIKVEKAAAEAVEDLSHLFFAQFSEALIAQAEETGKTKIMEKDIISLMKAQGQISSRNTLPFLARRYLPRELSDLITSTTSNDNTSTQRNRSGSRKAKTPIPADESINTTADATTD